jgi:8-oxo-dGTP pyrophosphatase MutT (NUDIX family)
MTKITVKRSELSDSHAFRQIAAGRLFATPRPHDRPSPGDYDLNPGAPALTNAFKPAAVLIPIVSRDPLTVLLTLRTGELGQGPSSTHAGQIAFPGGKIETDDTDAQAAALREAHEEIGLDPQFVEPLGFTEAYRTGTGYVITPVVALVRPGFDLTPNPSEVAEAFEVPFAFLMDEANHRIDSFTWRGDERQFYAMPFEQRYIWGATAGIIKALHRRLFEA